MSSVQNVLDRMMQTNETSASDENAPFYASATWQGPKAGYYFGTGLQGTGYYLDGVQDRKEKKARKSVQIDESNNEMRIFKSPISLLEQAERNASGSTVMELTPKGIQSASQALEKLFHKNALQRAQHADDPQQYMESELALHDQLEALSAVAANVQLYQHIVEHSTLIDTLIQLLGHENDDIAATVVSIFLEWLDPRLLRNDPDLNETIGILASRVLTGAWETIVSDLGRFQTIDTTTTQDDDMLKGIENSLSLMENLMDLDLVIPGGIVKQDGDSNLSAAAFMVKETKIVSWLVEQIEKEGVMVDFQSRCLELLSLLAQREDVHTMLTDWSKLQMYSLTLEKDQEPPAKKKRTTTTLDAIECMLQVIGRFRKTQPENESYTDLLENACLALSSCITFSKANLAVFVKGQGIELVVRCLKERVHSGVSALKMLEFVGHDEVHKEACDRLVAAGGLKFLFPLFLGTRIPKPAPSYGTTAKAKREWVNAIETQTIRIFYCLSQHLDDISAEDAKTRFIAKFAQDETKCDRLVELLLYYDEKCRKAEYLFYRSDVEEVVQDEETVQLAALDAKLKGGGDLFHRLGALAAYLAAHSKRCHERILEQLKLQQSGISLVKSAVEEFLSLLEDDSSRREQLNTYLTKI